MAEPVRITVDHELCVGSGMCVAVAPQVFRLNEERQAEVVEGDDIPLALAVEAADNCPVGAITVEGGR